jgi:Rieske Fe-S protein
MAIDILDIISSEQLEQLQENGYNVVPLEPHKGTLVSMALRDDHSFLMPAHGDPFDPRTPERMDGTLRNMSQLYEEATGSGFCQPENLDRYVASFEETKQTIKDLQENS